MSKKRTPTEYLQELFDKDIIDVPLEDYIDSGTAILHECLEGHICKRIPSNVLSGHKCPKCNDKTIPWTTDRYIEELEKLNIEYAPLEEYKNANSKILHLCIDCGNEWKSTPGNILRGKGCPICNKPKGVGLYNPTFFERNPEIANSPGILYAIVLVNKSTDERVSVKVGITKGTSNKDVLIRSAGFKGYEPRIQKIYKDTLENVFKAEQSLHKEFKDFRYLDGHKFGGHTECFRLEALSDILKKFPK